MIQHTFRNTLSLLCLIWSGLAYSIDYTDPFDTEASLVSGAGRHSITNAQPPCTAPIDNLELTLNQVVNLALCNNPQTHVSWENAKLSAAQVGLNQANYLPSLALNASDSQLLSGTSANNNQHTVGLTLSYLLYDFGSRSATLENARQLLAAANATQDSTLQNVLLSSIQAYYQTKATQAALEAASESEHASKESLAAAEARFKIGNATLADKLQAQTAYSQSILNRITATGNLKNAQGGLANILGFDASQPIKLTPIDSTEVPNNFEGDIDTLITVARQHRPDLQAVAKQINAAVANADAVRATGKPTISVTGTSNQTVLGSANTHSSTVGLNVNVPLFSGYATTYRIRSAEIQVELKRQQFEQLRLQVALDVWTAFQNLTTATQAVHTTEDLLKSAEQSEQVSLGRYKAGVGNILDTLNAQSALANARQQRIQSLLSWNISRATLAQTLGNLDENLISTLSSTAPSIPKVAPSRP